MSAGEADHRRLVRVERQRRAVTRTNESIALLAVKAGHAGQDDEARFSCCVLIEIPTDYACKGGL